METKGLTCKIPLELHDRITAEIRQNESTMKIGRASCRERV